MAQTRALRTTGRLFAVVDDAATAPAIVSALAQAGISQDAVTILRGTAGADRIDASGAATGIRARIRQLLSFTLVDQMPDFILYEAAVRDGRVVVAIRVRSERAKTAAIAILRQHGGHFINFYGRFATEEYDLWRGPELDIPGVLKR